MISQNYASGQSLKPNMLFKITWCGKVTQETRNLQSVFLDGNCDHIHPLNEAGVFERPGQTMDELCSFGTSRTSNGLKSGP